MVYMVICGEIALPSAGCNSYGAFVHRSTSVILQMIIVFCMEGTKNVCDALVHYYCGQTCNSPPKNAETVNVFIACKCLFITSLNRRKIPHSPSLSASPPSVEVTGHEKLGWRCATAPQSRPQLNRSWQAKTKGAQRTGYRWCKTIFRSALTHFRDIELFRIQLFWNSFTGPYSFYVTLARLPFFVWFERRSSDLKLRSTSLWLCCCSCGWSSWTVGDRCFRLLFPVSCYKKGTFHM